jgi:hypothetical protein
LRDDVSFSVKLTGRFRAATLWAAIVDTSMRMVCALARGRQGASARVPFRTFAFAARLLLLRTPAPESPAI